TVVLVTNLSHPASNGDSNLWAPLAMEDKLLTPPSSPMFSAIYSMQPFLNHDLDVSLPTRHLGLLIRPTPWPSFLADHFAEGNEIRPTPWPSFQIGVPSEDKDD
uniref:Uncharacterized protein n=1 Tax=Aegilops tauschii subsp. strangulata TaxID=200361 RepID=A0A453BLD8_AEGTS